MKERLEYIDIAKGIGILAVIYSHSGGENGLMAYIGGFFIPLFFVVSGFTYRAKEQESLMQYIKKKCVRLLVPYLLFSLLFLLINKVKLIDVIGTLYSRFCLYPYDIKDNIFFMEGGRAPMWFLTAMFTSLIAFWILDKCKRYQVYAIVLYALITYLFVFLPILLPWSIDVAFLFAIFVWIGTRIKNLDIHRISVPILLFLIIMYFALCYINGEPNLSVRIYGQSFLLNILTGTIGTILVVRCSMWIEHAQFGRVLSAFGRHSMTIFCLQMLLIRVQNMILFNMLGITLTPLSLYATSILKTILTAIIGVYISKALKWMAPKLF